MITPEAVVEKAKEYIGTPFHHAARKKGVGVDCAGLIVCVWSDLGVQLHDKLNYSQINPYPTLIEQIQKDFDEVQGEPQVGDIIIFHGKAVNAHCGIYVGDNQIIQAYHTGPISQVLQSKIADSWARRIDKVFRFRWQQ